MLFLCFEWCAFKLMMLEKNVSVKKSFVFSIAFTKDLKFAFALITSLFLWAAGVVFENCHPLVEEYVRRQFVALFILQVCQLVNLISSSQHT